MLRAPRGHVVAFRAAALHLDAKLRPDALADAVRPCGLQDTPPGNASLAAAARVDGLTPDLWAAAVERERVLVALWAMRGSPFVVATDDLPLFTAGLLPDDEKLALHLVTSGLRSAVEESHVAANDLVERLSRRAHEVLDGRVLTKRELGRELAPAVPEPLRSRFEHQERLAWGGYDGLSALTLTIARIVSHRGAFVIAPLAGNELSFVRTDQWLGHERPSLGREEARAELVRRFLRGFAPATPADYAWWATVHPDAATRVVQERDAKRRWHLIEGELEEVEREDGTRAFVLAADAPALASPPEPDGVRLLPPHDPFLMLHDRRTLLPDRFHRRVWRSQHNPGTVLAGTEVVATWTSRKKGRRLAVTVEPLAAPLPRETREAVEAEALPLGPLRSCDAVDLAFVG